MDEKSLYNSHFPPGIRFHPSDEELIIYYLQKKVKSLPLPANLMTDIELYKYNPWELPKKALFGEDEWYFFTPRDRKYPNGGRPNRTAASGFWKATGTDKPIVGSSGSGRIGVKKDLIFYKGKPPKGVKTDWVMTEYRLCGMTSRPLQSKGSMRLDDWVLCRVRQKGNKSKNAWEVQQNSGELLEYLPRIEEHPSVYIDDGREMFADYFLSNGCHLLASLLTGHDQTIETIPRATFQGNSSETINRHRLSTVNTPETNSSFQSFFNSLPGQPNKENWGLNFQLLTKMIPHQHEDKDLLSGNMVAAGDTNLYIQHMSERDNINYNPSNFVMNLQHLDMPTLSENFVSD
ncbi:NAC transcription factor 29-like [Olea europaea var. sylvestris]|uniref:NAC transcription factor 29-like n=1 Tax=Olea europaea var. sylvestris TaxID=158386 RepID=UPI000C1D2668|nr:NAC transcription factor 29-like [Olea europaea var. sylvestris]